MGPGVHLAMTAAALLLPCIFGLSIGRVDQKPCCSPDQWESLSGVIVAGNRLLSQGYVSYAFDYTNQMFGINVTYYKADGTIKSIQNDLYDGKAQKAYSLDVMTRRCSIEAFPGGFSRSCVPPDFNYETTIAFSDASQEVYGNVFVQISPRVNTTMTVSKQLCAPMSQLDRSNANDLLLQSFYNFTVGIKDRSVFNVPSECTMTEVDADFHGLHLEGDASAAQMKQRRSLQLPDMPCTMMFSPYWMMGNK